VERKRQTLSAAHINGGVEMRRLALAALEALEQAELNDTARFLQERLFTRDPASLVERDEQNTASWRFKPMAELLLLELTYIATAADMTPEQRRTRIDWTIEMSGL